MYEGFVVTNTHSGEGGDDPNPQTGDSIYTYIAMLLVCISGFLGFTRLYLNNN